MSIKLDQFRSSGLNENAKSVPYRVRPYAPLKDLAAPAMVDFLGVLKGLNFLILQWLPPRDSNPDMLIQSQLSYH